MAVIQGFLGFIKCEAASKNGVNPTTIKSITEDNILMGLVAYSTTVSATNWAKNSRFGDI
jgi:hypothetical protein